MFVLTPFLRLLGGVYCYVFLVLVDLLNMRFKCLRVLISDVYDLKYVLTMCLKIS